MSKASAPGLSDRLSSSYPILPLLGASDQVKEMKQALNKYRAGRAVDDPNFSEHAAQAWTGGELIEARGREAGVVRGEERVTAAEITKRSTP